MVIHGVENPSIELIKSRFFGYRLGVNPDEYGLDIEVLLIKLAEERNKTTIVPTINRRSSEYYIYVTTDYVKDEAKTIMNLRPDNRDECLLLVITPKIEDIALIDAIRLKIIHNNICRINEGEIVRLTRDVIEHWPC